MDEKRELLLYWPNAISLKPKHVDIPYHYVHLGETEDYLVKHGITVDMIDGEVMNTTELDIVKSVLKNNYSVMAVFFNTDNYQNTLRLLQVIKDLKGEDIKIVAYGDLPVLCPELFEDNKSIDAVVIKGDQEVSIKLYVDYVTGRIKKEELKSIYLKQGDHFEKFDEIAYEPVSEWGWTNMDKFHYDQVKQYNGKDQIVLTISRGCPYGCKFCNATLYYGIHERRREIEEVISYIKKVKKYSKVFKFFAPNFTLDKDYVIEFCKRIVEEKLDIEWTCTSRVDLLLNDEMIMWMGKAGCKQVAIGVESVNDDELKEIEKTYTESDIEEVVRMFHKYGIMFKALIMLGIPKQSKESILYTLSKLYSCGVRVRATAYTPMQNINKNMSPEEITRMNKRTYFEEVDGLDKKVFLNLVFDIENYRNILK